jgi:cysteine desulfurase
LRSGTLNVPGIVGFAKSLQLCLQEQPAEAARLRTLRDRLHQGLSAELEDVSLNGPALDPPDLRLANNLNLSFAYVDGEALMMSMKLLAVSSGSACTSANPEPSHVLRALGLSEDLTRASLRFGLGRFNTEADVDFAIAAVTEAVTRLRKLSSLAEG